MLDVEKCKREFDTQMCHVLAIIKDKKGNRNLIHSESTSESMR